MVGKLVRKDFLYLFKSLRSTLYMSIIFAFFIPMINIGFGLVMPALVCYIGFYNVLAFEERSKMNLINVALPVKRQEICLAKYIQVIIFIVAGSILSILGIFLRQAINVNDIIVRTNDLLTLVPMMVAIALIYSSLILPCVFRFGTIKARYVLMAFYILIFIVANSLNNEMWMEVVARISSIGTGGLAGIIMMLVSMLVCVLSYTVSLKIWNKRDF